MLEYQVEAYRQNWRPEASYFAVRGGEKGSEPLDEVFETTVLSDLERLYIRYPGLGGASGRVVQLWFTRTGTWCEVEGDDTVWVASMSVADTGAPATVIDTVIASEWADAPASTGSTYR